MLIKLADGSSRLFDNSLTYYQIAESLSKSLSKKAIVAMVNGRLLDLSTVATDGDEVLFITADDDNHINYALDVIRHDCAHILAQAVKRLFPGVQVTIGPVIENGFYYDFSTDRSFTVDDLSTIESEMMKISSAKYPITRSEVDKNSAIDLFKSAGELFKEEIINDILDETVSLYKQGEFVDLCRGPHSPHTGFVKHFKLLSVAGAYWRGDSNRESLQRIYGTAWLTKEDLDAYLLQIEEAEKRDHRKIAKLMHLFHQQPEAPGDVFWHKDGFAVYNILQQYIRNKVVNNGYCEVKTPLLLKRNFWEDSGHWEKYKENMFSLKVDDADFALKPMNCPCHVQIFNQNLKSYRDLPLRISEFGCCHRYEHSGALHGLMRVRNMTQDDGHIFCTEEQINNETVVFCRLLNEIYNELGFNKITIKLSTRPSIRAGSDEIWDKSEGALKEAIIGAGYDFSINEGEGAFYGPKLEFVIKDAIGRDWQCGTLQVDFILPERLNASYIDSDGTRKRPVMLHRAILGSFERFIGIMIESCAGKFPLWLAPTQVVICSLNEEIADYCNVLLAKLAQGKIRAIGDFENQTINYKIRNHFLTKKPIIVVVGKKEVESGDLSVTFNMNEYNDKKNMTIDELTAFIKEETKIVCW